MGLRKTTLDSAGTCRACKHATSTLLSWYDVNPHFALSCESTVKYYILYPVKVCYFNVLTDSSWVPETWNYLCTFVKSQMIRKCTVNLATAPARSDNHCETYMTKYSTCVCVHVVVVKKSNIAVLLASFPLYFLRHAKIVKSPWSPCREGGSEEISQKGTEGYLLW